MAVRDAMEVTEGRRAPTSYGYLRHRNPKPPGIPPMARYRVTREYGLLNEQRDYLERHGAR